MKVIKFMALSLLALLPFLAEAQNTEQLDARIDSLAEETATLDKIVKGLSKFKVSAYIQGQYQYGQEDATLKVGDKNEHEDKGFNRIGIRRGRLKFEYNDGIGTGAVQIEANDKGVSFRDLYIGIKDPWTKRSQLMVFSTVPSGMRSDIPPAASSRPNVPRSSSTSFPTSAIWERC